MKHKLTRADLSIPIRRGIVQVSSNFGLRPATDKRMFFEYFDSTVKAKENAPYPKGYELKEEYVSDSGETISRYRINGAVKIEGAFFFADAVFSGNELIRAELKPRCFREWEKYNACHDEESSVSYNADIMATLGPWIQKNFGEPDFKDETGDYYDAPACHYRMKVQQKNEKGKIEPVRLIFVYRTATRKPTS